MSQSTAGPARSGLSLSKTSLLQAPVQDQHPIVLKPPQSLSSALLPPPYPRTSRSFIHHRLAKTHFELIVLYSLWNFLTPILYDTVAEVGIPFPLSELVCSPDL